MAQNKDHEKVIKAIFRKEKIHNPVIPIVVLTNHNTMFHFKRGASEYKNKVFRNDRLEENLLQMEKINILLGKKKK